MNIGNIQDWIVPFSITISVIGTISVALGTFIAMFYNTKRKEEVQYSERLIQTLKENADAERLKAERLAEENRTQREDFQKQINSLKVDVANLKSMYEAAEKSKQEYLEILKDKNPEQVKFMEYLTKAATMSNKTQEEAKAYMDNTGQALKEILFFMKDLHDRNTRVDEKVVPKMIEDLKNIKSKGGE